MSYFPMYIDLEDALCLVVGGGRIAVRKVEILLDFGAKVVVVAPKIDERLKKVSKVQCLVRQFQAQDIEGAALVVAATEHTDLNHEISVLCRQQNIPVNAVDQKEDCTFLFPAYVKRGQVTAAVTTEGASPMLAGYLKGQLEKALPEKIGELASALGQVRPYVKHALSEERQRKWVFKRLLDIGLSNLNHFQNEEKLFCQADVECLVKEAQDAHSNRDERIEIGYGPDKRGL